MKKHKVLVTGVAGFIGSNLADRLLAAGHEVVGIDNLAYGRLEQVPKGVDFRKLDIRSEDIRPAFKGVDVVFHMAAKNDLVACQLDPVETMSINVHGTANVFEAARRAEVRKVVFSSSSALEEGEARLKGFYAISKTACEAIAEGYRAAFELNYVLPRYFNVYGPRQDYRRKNPPVVSALMIKVMKNEAPTLYDNCEENKRDFVYVDDLSDFHLLCLDDDRLNNRLFRLGTGVSVSMKEVWEAVKKVTGSKLSPVIKPHSVHDTPTVTLADITDAKKFGWSPKTSFEAGLKAQFEYLKKEFAAGKIV
ncbi:MAG TPA: NAD-dependent epimerase/dehydratase family protein [Candidatus Paceibacterota bacterium]|nr:NAD-dependent epimerase/dehydratase family protein [Candidatus Paceibacterota bacterium]